MTADQLLSRTEHMVWEPPLLSFVIERHGALVGGGSTRGELQRWQVNVETSEAECFRAGHRQLRPAAPPVRAQQLADEIVYAIVRHDTTNPAIDWLRQHEYG
jgi:hypothetical protein